MTERLLDRLEDCKRSFPAAAVLGGASDVALARLGNGRAGIRDVLLLDASPAMLDRARHQQQQGEGQWLSLSNRCCLLTLSMPSKC